MTAISSTTSWTGFSNLTETGIFCSMKAAIPITSRQKNAVLANFRRKLLKQQWQKQLHPQPGQEKRYRYRHGCSFRKEKNNDWKQNRPIRLKFTFKEQREYETIDDDIAALEEK